MPFSMTNAPVVFMIMIDMIFALYLDQFVMVFIDDILLYSKTRENYEKYLRIVLQFLRKERLYGKLSKYEFWLDHIMFLGQIV